jgi:cation transport protein ChaC
MNMLSTAVGHARDFSAHHVPVMTRSLLQAGGVEKIYRNDAPGIELLSDEDRAESLAQMLASRPDGDVWVFGYGSLIWNPSLKTAERRIARIEGWHRSFCYSVIAGRGSPLLPGLVLGLDGGGDCWGAAYRLAEGDVEDELALLWNREMQCRAYVPHWIELHDASGDRFGHGIAFTMDPLSKKYAGAMSEETTVYRLARAEGGLGSSADYLYRTCNSLRDSGIPDADLECLAAQVRIEQSKVKIRLAE